MTTLGHAPRVVVALAPIVYSILSGLLFLWLLLLYSILSKGDPNDEEQNAVRFAGHINAAAETPPLHSYLLLLTLYCFTSTMF